MRYRINDRGERVYETAEKVMEAERLSKYVAELEGKDDLKAMQFEVFEHSQDQLDDNQDDYYRRELPLFNQETFYNLGRNILISILDIWNKNPSPRANDLNSDRREIAERQAKLDRFRKEQAGIKAKQKKIVELIEDQFYAEWHRRNVFTSVLLNPQPQRDKKRNHTLQIQRAGLVRGQKQ